ncbi:MAG: hypothetical protein R2939_04680 [Kofleriaceae bacterium]
MKTTTLLASLGSGLTLALLTGVAAAQPGGGPPGPPPPPPQSGPGSGGYYATAPQTAPGGFMHQGGRLTLGVSLGLGSMEAESGPLTCINCDYSPIAGGVAAHIGGMLNPRLALMLELQANVQTVREEIGGTQSLVQTAAMVAAQYWATPRLWLKGGLGAAHLSFSYDDAYGSVEQPIDDGVAVLGAVGYELISAPRHSLDLQGRILVGGYDGIDDQITAAQIGVGFNWF